MPSEILENMFNQPCFRLLFIQLTLLILFVFFLFVEHTITCVLWFSLVIGQIASRQLATSSENKVASARFLRVALATSESRSRALLTAHNPK